MSKSIIHDFPIIPVNKRSIANRSPIYGIGVNDAPFQITFRVNGKCSIHPIYSIWSKMFDRCYNRKRHENQASYIGCSVASEWHLFMNFHRWAINLNWQGKHLDKDLLIDGNKIYGPDACVFVTPQINSLLNDQSAKKGIYPTGVSVIKSSKKFIATISKYRKKEYIGSFDTLMEAHNAYINAKADHIFKLAKNEPTVIQRVLVAHAEKLLTQLQRLP